MKLIARGCASGETCPAVLELDDGDYLVIGKIPAQAHLDDLPAGVGIGPDETALVLPRTVLRDAVLDLGRTMAGVQCWHTEAGSPCDWNECKQPERPDIPPPLHLNAIMRSLNAKPASSVPAALRGPNWRPGS